MARATVRKSDPDRAPARTPALAAIPLVLLLLAACGTEPDGAHRLPDGFRLLQKRQYQALYGPTGRLVRVLYDENADGVAEAVVLYRADGKPERSELDTDGDHSIDRWETLRPDGTVAVSAHSRRRSGVPDAWAYLDADGTVYQRDFDDDGDGEVDRTEYDGGS